VNKNGFNKKHLHFTNATCFQQVHTIYAVVLGKYCVMQNRRHFSIEANVKNVGHVLEWIWLISVLHLVNVIFSIIWNSLTLLRLRKSLKDFNIMKKAVFWVVAPCRLVRVYQRFRCLYCLHHQGDRPEDGLLHSDGRGNLKSFQYNIK
jgi:hypothetical protein